MYRPGCVPALTFSLSFVGWGKLAWGKRDKFNIRIHALMKKKQVMSHHKARSPLPPGPPADGPLYTAIQSSPTAAGRGGLETSYGGSRAGRAVK